MKKIMAIGMTLALVFMLVACGGAADEAVGKYTLAEMTIGGEKIDLATMDLEALGIAEDVESMVLELKADKTFTISILGDNIAGKWAKDGENYVLTSASEDLPVVYNKDEKTMTLEEDGMGMVFKK